MFGDAVSWKDNTTSILNSYQGQRAVRLFAPVYGPALLLVLAGCHKVGHIGPKPNTGAPEMAPFIAGEIDGLDGPETMSFAAADERVYADLATDGVQPDQVVYFRGDGDDVLAIRADFKQEFASVRKEMAAMEDSIRKEMAAMEERMDLKLQAVEQRLERKIVNTGVINVVAICTIMGLLITVLT